ncbi:glucose-6-phosphate 1-dehydrogenase [Formosimonas limnophila]|uniref:Glucose-6-phosphate 1-dehydrogenase n=1 Tax=Formosimonas limnophila TaxID=1384487 RepID=A0A8J3CN21_9BURK|nr:glucose-6-phosphate dehydrogenase [Formosimonas limnophila]GHA73593.1 glucose-6-phosphate 1-dehydrogenase [Formosimonas limnophila]
MSSPKFSLVMFGGTGDLAMRKLLPALYQSYIDDGFQSTSRVICAARTVYTSEQYREWMNESVKKHVSERLDDVKWSGFLQRIEYHPLNATDANCYVDLKNILDQNDNERVYYLATSPSIFEPICQGLASQGLNKNSRIVVEKPLGHDLASCQEINDVIGSCFEENQIYRIDHYLGKESVQNLMALRFGNSFFEPIWRRERIDNVQITISEELGVEKRAEFYDETGALRDMVQNHLLQLLCIVAMDPPASMDADAVRDAKLAVLRSLKPMSETEVLNNVVRGQYNTGTVLGKDVPAYTGEEGVKNGSVTETYVALKAEINNWRFAGVPFYLRTGKRMPKRMAEIVVQFKPVAYELLGKMPQGSNRLVIQLQPEESMRMYCLAKRPGNTMRLGPVHLDMDSDDFFTERRMDGYERLLLDAIHGNLSLFVRRDEQEAAWRWVEPIMNTWRDQNVTPKLYTAGTWGPPAANALVARDGFNWHEEL